MAARIRYSEEELVRALKLSNREAFAVLYDNYSRALLGVVKKNIPGDEIAEDVLQDAFIKIWNNRSSYDPAKGRLYTWMLNIVRNTSIDYLRSRHHKMDEKIRDSDNAVNELNSGGNVVINTDRIGIRKIVDSLKEEHRVLIDLAYFEGYTQDEVSKKLEIPLGTVKTRLRAALSVLRKLIR